jgi:hypothetical protein
MFRVPNSLEAVLGVLRQFVSPRKVNVMPVGNITQFRFQRFIQMDALGGKMPNFLVLGFVSRNAIDGRVADHFFGRLSYKITVRVRNVRPDDWLMNEK